MNATLFFKTFNKVPERARTLVVDVVVSPGATVMEMVLAAEPICGKKLSARSGQTGVFEIQTDEGIWSAEGKCLLTRAARFATWEQLEAADATP